MSENVRNLEEEFENLERRIGRLETLLGKSGTERAEASRVDDIFEWQRNTPRIIDYDIWSIVLAKRHGTDDMKMGCYSGGDGYAKVTDLSPEDAANLAGALSHPARILILRECEKTTQYSSDLEKTVTAKYGALYHHLNSLVEANLLAQEKERGKYVTTSAGKTALVFINTLASVIASIEAQAAQPRTEHIA